MAKKRRNAKLYLVRNDDDFSFATPDQVIERTLAWLRRAGVPFEQPWPNHIKIGILNFYPTSGTLNYDNKPRLSERGLAGLKLTLERLLRRELPPID